jgi:hypothetical protein
MREHTPRGMEWVCLQIFRCGRGQENIIKARVVSVVAPSAPLATPLAGCLYIFNTSSRRRLFYIFLRIV